MLVTNSSAAEGGRLLVDSSDECWLLGLAGDGWLERKVQWIEGVPRWRQEQIFRWCTAAASCPKGWGDPSQHLIVYEGLPIPVSSEDFLL